MYPQGFSPGPRLVAARPHDKWTMVLRTSQDSPKMAVINETFASIIASFMGCGHNFCDRMAGFARATELYRDCH
jgi:hypothetical protein